MYSKSKRRLWNKQKTIKRRLKYPRKVMCGGGSGGGSGGSGGSGGPT